MALRTLPLGPEYDDERTLATMKLMEYFKATDRIEQYIEYVRLSAFLIPSLSDSLQNTNRYVYQLCEKHMSMNNYVEAGFTLLLQADMLDWSDKLVPAIPSRNIPEETSYERKVFNTL